jgi:uncharacterized membrane protein YhaH (DUF805 family)
MDWYVDVLKKYAVFAGRARRKEYWVFTLVNLVISVLLAFVDSILGTMAIGLIYALAVLLPSIAVTVRRLHDTGRSGWWALIVLLPILGVIVLLVMMCFDSQSGDNAWGPNPKAAAG